MGVFCGILRFLVTAAAVPLCAQLMDGVRAVDMSNAIVLGLLLGGSFKGYWKLMKDSGYGVDYIKSVDKPFQTDADSATGWMYGGTGKTFPSIMMLTQTWNAQLAEDLGEMMGNEALLGGANGWYAPA